MSMATTKKTMRVTITKEIEVEINDECLTPEWLAAFTETMFEIEGPVEMFGYVAGHIARFGNSFIEGVGPASTRYAVAPANARVLWRELSEDVEAEEVEP
jgi:hypothetical protein